MEWLTATAAFFLPMRRARRQNWAARYVSRRCPARQAHWLSISPSQGSPGRVLPERRLPPVMLVPGASPAQEARWPAVGKRLMSTPISAMIASAARSPTPGMVQRRERASAKGTPVSLTWVAKRASIWASRRAIWRSRYSACSRAMPTIRAWWSLKRPRSASLSWGIFFRITPSACSARTSGSRSPATRALSMMRPETVIMSDATTSSLMPASSRVFSVRWNSAVTDWTSLLR